MKQTLVNYDVVSEIAGHQSNTGVKLVDAAKDIFTRCKEKSMQCAVKGDFIEFDSVNELQSKLSDAVKKGFNIRIFDEVIGG